MQVKKMIGMLMLAALAAAIMPSTPTAAQATNLLTNPGLEQPYEGDKQATGWGRWFQVDSCDTRPTGYNYVCSPTFSPELNSAIVRTGGVSQHIGNKYDPWHAGIKQTVTVPAKTPLRFCAFGRLFANNEDFEKANSIGSFNGRMQVGIFPNGDADWNTGGIIWSPEYNPHGFWQEICVETTSGDAGKVTVFTSSSYRGFAAYHLDAWWDDASLVTTAPPATTAPTAPATPPVAPSPVTRNCETRADGSVVYVVQSGDTLGAIAIACDSTVEEIQRLNGLSGTLINSGQTLIVKAPTAPPTAVPQPTAEAAPIVTPEQAAVPTDGQVCVEAFNDANANQSKEAGEQLLGGVGFTLSDAVGIKGSYVTNGLEPEPYCFGGLQPGSYTVDARAPLGVNDTTAAQWPVGLTAGMKFEVQYGGSRSAGPSAPNVPAEAEPTEAVPSGSGSASPVDNATSDLGRIAMGAIGVIILLGAGFMAGLVLMRARR